MKNATLAFAALFAAILTAPSRAEMIVTGLVTSAFTASSGDAGLGIVFDPQFNFDVSLRQSDFDESNSHISSTDPRGTVVSANGHSELGFNINAPAGTILAGGSITGHAQQSSPTHIDGDARVSAHSAVEVFFTLTSAYSYSLDAVTHRTANPDFGVDTSEIAFQDGDGSSLLSSTRGTIASHGILQPGTYYLAGFVGATTETPCCLPESSGAFDYDWELRFALTPVPLPAAIWLLASAILGFGFLGARRLF